MEQVLKQRMYNLVLYSLSPIQQGIQSYHAGIEYALKYGDTEEYKQWAKKDKTIIILNGGTSNKEGHSVYDYSSLTAFGTMETYYSTLFENHIPFACFYEPDLNNCTSAIAFLVNEKVWDKEKYPDTLEKFNDPRSFDDWLKGTYGTQVAFLRTFLKQFKLA